MRVLAIFMLGMAAALLLTACPKASTESTDGAQANAGLSLLSARYAPPGAEFHWLLTSDNYNIASWYYPPREREGAAPTLILVHMRGKDKSTWQDIAPKMVAEGYAVIAIDLRSHGESLDPGDRQPALRSLKNEDYLLMLRDIRAAHDFINDQPEADAERVAIVGASIGANLGIIYASADRRVRTVVALSPGLDYYGLKPADYLTGYGPRALYLLAAKDDKESFESCLAFEQLATLANPVSFRELDGKAHGTDLFAAHPGLDETVITGWLFNHLPPK